MIYYDITDILDYARHHGTLSGIQRVSIQLLTRLINKHGTLGLRLIAFHPVWKRIISYDPSYFSGAYRYDQADLSSYFGLIQAKSGWVTLESYLEQKYSGSWKSVRNKTRLLILNALTSGRTFEKRKIIKASRRPRLAQEVNVAFAPGDVVLLVGATWNFESYLSALARQRRDKGILVYQFIHDLIPILSPEHVLNGVPKHFLHWLTQLASNTDLFLTNSLATKLDLDAWLDRNASNVESRVMTLAHQFGDSPRSFNERFETNEDVGANVLNAARLPYVLCVGTLESRKNIWNLAHVWKQVHVKLGDGTPRLVFAGNPGWLRDDFDDFIRGTGSLYGYIRVLERPNDAELAFLYKNSLFSVFPSYKEGWGLPIGESLWFGRPVVCSNVSSMPEVGGSLADYVDPTSRDSIEAAVIKMITDSSYREERAAEIVEASLRTWSDVADDLWRELSSATRRWRVSVPSCLAGSSILPLNPTEATFGAAVDDQSG
jgi:glycosyltransferase involved in cell wall biosynthesis